MTFALLRAVKFRFTLVLAIVTAVSSVVLQPVAAQQRRERKPVKWVNPKLPTGTGLEHKVLASEAMGHDVGYVVWVPPAYDSNGKTQYPVI